MPTILNLAKSKSIAACAFAMLFAFSAGAAWAAKGYSVLTEFCSDINDGCPNGDVPLAGLISDSDGNVYGTTYEGGAETGGGCGGGCGVIYEIAPNGNETVLYTFCAKNNACADGASPMSQLFRDKGGNLYGTTNGGGKDGEGTVFKLAPDGSETVLYYFGGNDNGASPTAGVISDAKGNLYGTARYGGPVDNAGTVFELTKAGAFKLLYSFCAEENCVDGQGPYGSLIRDSSGNLYGTTYGGGANTNSLCVMTVINSCGTVFKIARDGTETVLYSFCSMSKCKDGAEPMGSLVMDSAGDLYGMTEYGGVSGRQNCAFNSCGVVFELTPAGTETVLYSFCSQGGCADGANPAPGAGLSIAADEAVLYGTTEYGGENDVGTVFKLSAGTEIVLHSFSADGTGLPQAGVLLRKGYLYGTSVGTCCAYSSVLFKLGTKGD